MRSLPVPVIWAALVAALVGPVAASLASPLLAWRQPVYIVAGLAGVVGLALMLLQPLLAGGYLPGLPALRGRRVHRWIGGLLTGAVLVHVAGLWITSPPDVVDALLFASPTPFSAWGVVAMWAILVTAALAILRRPLKLRPRTWRVAHTVLFSVIVAGTCVHAVLIQGTMETVSKLALCALVLAATVRAVVDLRVWTKRRATR